MGKKTGVGFQTVELKHLLEFLPAPYMRGKYGEMNEEIVNQVQKLGRKEFLVFSPLPPVTDPKTISNLRVSVAKALRYAKLPYICRYSKTQGKFIAFPSRTIKPPLKGGSK